MNILGIHIGHDSSASLVVDGKIVADAAEERFARIKHYSGLPINAIDFCLKAGNISIRDIDFIAVPAKGSCPKLNFLLDLKGEKLEKGSGPRRMLEFAHRIIRFGVTKPPLYIKNFPIKDSTEIIHVRHHLAHAASAYYTCGSQEKQLIVTMDGVGDSFSVSIWRGENGRVAPLKNFPSSASVGWFYSNVTEALGWWHGDGEGKTMGLASYGDYAKVKGLLDAYYPKFNKGELVKSHDFGIPYSWNENGAYQWHFDESYKIKNLIDKYGREDIAAEAQRILEEQVMDIIFAWLEKENTKNLCCAGGVFLNVKLNQRIWNSGKVKNHHIFPNPGDAGLSLGAALYVYYKLSEQSKINKITDVYWGPQFSNDEIESILKGRSLKYEYCEDISERCAELLAEGKIIGWFQSRMESGPRALGNRSILMSPEKAENKDIINARVKFREAFRPFCPSILEEARQEYLNGSREEPFMITSFDVNATKRDKIQAVAHVDGTVRPQTLQRKVNPKYHDLIKRFGDITGIPVLLNTSFNIRGEPIVCSPRDAIKCFYDTGLDYLAIGNFLLSKGE
jgi:carbamoyltransferase